MESPLHRRRHQHPGSGCQFEWRGTPVFYWLNPFFSMRWNNISGYRKLNSFRQICEHSKPRRRCRKRKPGEESRILRPSWKTIWYSCRRRWTVWWYLRSFRTWILYLCSKCHWWLGRSSWTEITSRGTKSLTAWGAQKKIWRIVKNGRTSWRQHNWNQIFYVAKKKRNSCRNDKGRVCCARIQRQEKRFLFAMIPFSVLHHCKGS